MIECSYVCQAENIPHSSLWRVDIFCSALSKLLELEEIIHFHFGNCWKRIQAVPTFDEST